MKHHRSQRFDQLLNIQMKLTCLFINKANLSDTETAFLDLNLSIHNDIVSTKIYDNRDDFNFDIVNFPFLDRNRFLTAKLLKQGYLYHKLCKAFSKFYRRHFELIEKYHVSLKKHMQQGIYNPEF